MKNFTLRDSQSWTELGLGFWMDLQLDKNIVSDDIKLRGRWFGLGFTFLKWRVSWSCMFDCQPYAP